MDHAQPVRELIDRDKPVFIPAADFPAKCAVGWFRNAVEKRTHEGEVIPSFDKNLMLRLRDRQFVRSRNEFDQPGERQEPRPVSIRRHWNPSLAGSASSAQLVIGIPQHLIDVIAARVITLPVTAEVSRHIALEILRVFEEERLFVVGTAGQAQPGCEKERREASGTWVAGDWQDSRITHGCGVRDTKF